MEGFGTVSDTMDIMPSSKITIIYANGKNVEPGQEFTPTEVKDEPEVKWEADPTKYYTLIMVDPDVPSRENPTLADVKHWLVVNILGSNVSTGDVIAEYVGSGAPKGTGLHRYIFLVFEQKDMLKFDEPRSLKLSKANRLKWSMQEFKEKYGLGQALAGNYFEAQWDPYVEELSKCLTDD